MLAFVVISGDGTLVSQSKSADYYQSSFVILRRELGIEKSRLYVFNQFVSRVKIVFLIPLSFLDFKQICSFQVKLLLKLRVFLYQKLTSFIRQLVFVNEAITSNNLYKSLYSA